MWRCFSAAPRPYSTPVFLPPSPTTNTLTPTPNSPHPSPSPMLNDLTQPLPTHTQSGHTYEHNARNENRKHIGAKMMQYLHNRDIRTIQAKGCNAINSETGGGGDGEGKWMPEDIAANNLYHDDFSVAALPDLIVHRGGRVGEEENSSPDNHFLLTAR